MAKVEKTAEVMQRLRMWGEPFRRSGELIELHSKALAWSLKVPRRSACCKWDDVALPPSISKFIALVMALGPLAWTFLAPVWEIISNNGYMEVPMDGCRNGAVRQTLDTCMECNSPSGSLNVRVYPENWGYQYVWATMAAVGAELLVVSSFLHRTHILDYSAYGVKATPSMLRTMILVYMSALITMFGAISFMVTQVWGREQLLAANDICCGPWATQPACLSKPNPFASCQPQRLLACNGTLNFFFDGAKNAVLGSYATTSTDTWASNIGWWVSTLASGLVPMALTCFALYSIADKPFDCMKGTHFIKDPKLSKTYEEHLQCTAQLFELRRTALRMLWSQHKDLPMYYRIPWMVVDWLRAAPEGYVLATLIHARQLGLVTRLESANEAAAVHVRLEDKQVSAAFEFLRNLDSKALTADPPPMLNPMRNAGIKRASSRGNMPVSSPRASNTGRLKRASSKGVELTTGASPASMNSSSRSTSNASAAENAV